MWQAVHALRASRQLTGSVPFGNGCRPAWQQVGTTGASAGEGAQANIPFVMAQ